MIVLGGNMRLKACKEAGLKEVPIIIADNLTEDQQREFIIKDNISGGEWDWDILANEWDIQDLSDWGIDIPNFENPIISETTETQQPDYKFFLVKWPIDKAEIVGADLNKLADCEITESNG
jgi:hypothetical protein